MFWSKRRGGRTLGVLAVVNCTVVAGCHGTADGDGQRARLHGVWICKDLDIGGGFVESRRLAFFSSGRLAVADHSMKDGGLWRVESRVGHWDVSSGLLMMAIDGGQRDYLGETGRAESLPVDVWEPLSIVRLTDEELELDGLGAVGSKVWSCPYRRMTADSGGAASAAPK